jgi:uncharacterized repeat protein (TIGR01451 family)
MQKDSKGAAELIGVILVIAVAISASVLIGLNFSKFTRDQTEEIESQAGYIDCNYASISFDNKDIFYNKQETGSVNITIRNNGQVNLTNFTIFVYRPLPAELSVVSATQRTSTNPLAPGEIFRLESTGNTSGMTKIRVISGNCPHVSREVDV